MYLYLYACFEITKKLVLMHFCQIRTSIRQLKERPEERKESAFQKFIGAKKLLRLQLKLSSGKFKAAYLPI
jgi:hypothetical protein